jgi:aryl-alcohol dehydrogenase-like predicted oxidoreductase
LQPPYSLVTRGVQDEILPYCEASGIGTIVYSPMGSGLLTGAFTRERAASLPKEDWRNNNPNFKEPKLSENLELVERLKKVGADHGRTAGEAAIAWTLRLPAVNAAIVGARAPGQVDGFIGAMDFRLTPEEVAYIEG